MLIPTTGDRGDLLRCSIASVLRQTENRLEVLVVGDGMSSNSRKAIEGMARLDDRIRIFDFPLLKDADLAHGLVTAIRPDGQALIEVGDLTRESHRRLTVKGAGSVPLSTWGHTLSFYRKLPRGWETPPAGWASDQHMLAQLLAHPECKVATTMVPTVLQFQKVWHGKIGWTPLRGTQDAVALWRQELPLWLEKSNGPDFCEKFREHAMEQVILEQQTQIDELATTIRFFHRHPFRYVSGKIKAKLKSRIEARLKSERARG